MRPILAILCVSSLLLAETSQQGWEIRRLQNSEVTPAITANAVQILRDHRHDPYGTDIPFSADGKDYVGRIEQHYHTPGGAATPWGYHPGVSVFLVVSTTPGVAPASDALDPVRNGNLLLRRGSRGEEVRALQQALTAVGISLGDDGIFGPLTEAGVRSFQQSAGITVDGVVGPQTIGALDVALAPPAGQP